jgi:hypothetical protein
MPAQECRNESEWLGETWMKLYSIVASQQSDVHLIMSDRGGLYWNTIAQSAVPSPSTVLVTLHKTLKNMPRVGES